MAKVGVHISGSEDLSKAAGSAVSGLKKFADETERVKKSAKDILAPLINLRSTLLAVGGAAGLVQVFRAVTREIGEAVNAFAKVDATFGATMGNWKSAVTDFKVGIGGVVAQVAGPFLEAMTRVAKAMADNMATARDLRQAINDVGKGTIVSDAQKIEDQLSAVLKKMIEIIELQDRGGVRREMVGYYDEELQKLNQVRVALLQQKAAIKEVAATQELLNSIIARGAEIEGMALAWEAELEGVRALIRGSSQLGKVLEIQGKIATLKAYSFENEGRYEEARLDALKRLQEELDKLTEQAAESAVKVVKWFGSAVSELTAYGSPSEIAQVGSGGGPSMFQYGLTSSVGTESGVELGRGDGGLAQMEALRTNMEAFDAALGESTLGMMGYTGQVIQSIQQMGALGLVYEALKPVLFGLFSVLGPAVEGIVKPLLGALVSLGKGVGNFLVPIIELLIPILDALSRPLEWVGDLLSWFGQWIRYGIDQLRVFFYNLTHWLEPTTATVSSPGAFSSDAFTRPLGVHGDTWDLGGEYLATQANSGGYSGGSTTVEHQPDIYITIRIEGNVIGAGGPAEVGREMGRALEAYAGIGGRLHIEAAVVP